ncbi:stalk domain-containing protein [Cohnella yongneupensis]|uniref:Stalk domain-containing protein n=1 Tax=Cohnella yongneupensis TaxID=425006 RepID=A0ABW0R180_9BACL
MRLSYKKTVIVSLAALLWGTNGLAMAAGEKAPLVNQSGQIMQTISTLAGNPFVSLGMPTGLTLGTDGTLYIANAADHNVIRLKNGVSSVLAGSASSVFPDGGLLDGSKDEALFHSPSAVASGPDGSLYVADSANNAIRQITPAGKVVTLAGNGIIGSKDGRGSGASFYDPEGIAVSKAGVVYVADTLNHLIRKIDKDGTTTTLNAAPQRVVEIYPGMVQSAGDYKDGDLSEALFNEPHGLALDAKGNLYVSDTGNQTIRYIDFSLNRVTTVAGTIAEGGSVYAIDALYASGGYRDGKSNNALFHSPQGIALDSAGGLIIADSLNHSIRYLNNGIVSTLAGNGATNESGMHDGVETSALFDTPKGVTVAANGTIYVADTGNRLIRQIVNYALPTNLPNDKTIKVFYENKAVPFDAKPVMKKGRVMVPVRAIAEALGYEVKSTDNGQKVVLSKDKLVIELSIGQTTIRRSVSGTADVIRKTDVAPYVSNNRTYVPLRFFAEEIGLDVQWQDKQQTAVLRIR